MDQLFMRPQNWAQNVNEIICAFCFLWGYRHSLYGGIYIGGSIIYKIIIAQQSRGFIIMTKFFLEQNKGHGKKKPRTAGHVTDYRIIAFKKMSECAKKFRLFEIQKIIKQLKKNPGSEQVPVLEEQMKKLKSIDAKTFKHIVCYLLKYQLDFDLDKVGYFFWDTLHIDNSLLTSLEQSRSSDSDSAVNQFISSLGQSKLYQQTMEEIGQVTDKVDKKKLITKVKKEKKKERVKAKKEESQAQVVPSEQADKEVEQSQIAQESAPASSNNHDSQQANPKEVKQLTKSNNKPQKPKPNKPQYLTRYDNPQKKERTEFKKRGRNKIIKKDKMNKGREQRDEKPKKEAKVNPFLSKNQEMHPSWQAKQQTSKLPEFQGKKIVLS